MHVLWFRIFDNYLKLLSTCPFLSSGRLPGRSPTPAIDANHAADVGVEKLECLRQKGAHLRHPHEEEGHSDHRVPHGDHLTRRRLWSNVAIP